MLIKLQKSQEVHHRIIQKHSNKYDREIPKKCLCGYCNAYVLVKGTITVANTAAQGQPKNDANKMVIKIVHHLLNA